METITAWLSTSFPAVAMSLFTLIVIYLAIIAYCRLVGVRSFATISAFDFAMTVAVGSLFATSIASPNPSLPLALIAFAGLFAAQWTVGQLRRKSRRVRGWVDNQPLLLMRDGEILEANLRRARITRDDLRAKLREANVLQYSQVRAVVAETTGDVSVLAASDPEVELDPDLLTGVRAGDDSRATDS